MAVLTLGDLIDQSLRQAGVIRENQAPSAEQNRDAIDTFNGLMSMWDADGIELGDFPVELIGDELDLEREHKEPVRVLFAVALGADHGLPPDPLLLGEAEIALRFLERNTFVRPDFSLENMPLGRAKNHRFNINNG